MSMFDMVKKAQEMQSRLGKLQEEVKALEKEGKAGGGAVCVRVKGTQEVLAVNIDPSVVDPADVGTLEDLVRVAVNDAVRQIQTEAETKMKALTGGIKIPGLSL